MKVVANAPRAIVRFGKQGGLPSRRSWRPVSTVTRYLGVSLFTCELKDTRERELTVRESFPETIEERLDRRDEAVDKLRHLVFYREGVPDTVCGTVGASGEL